MDHGFKPIRLLIGLFLVIFLAQGCAKSLPAVREFSQATVAASSSFEPIMNDIPKSCERRVEFTFTGDKYEIEQPSNEVKYTEKYQEHLKTCGELRRSLDGIIIAHDVLQDYAKALGNLASDDVVTYTEDIEALEAAVKSVEINGSRPFDDPKVSAISGIAKLLTNIAAEGYRRKKLKEVINGAHPHLVVLIEGLENVVEDYKAELNGEKIAIEAVQINLIKRLKKVEEELSRVNKNSALAVVLEVNRDDLSSKIEMTLILMEFIENKKKAADDYIEILKSISSTHQKLYESRDKLESKELIETIKNYVSQLVPLVNDIRQAF